MNTKTTFFILFFVILSSFCYAEATQFYKVNQEVDLKVPCVKNDNNVCSPSATCNLTISYPNNSIYINNEEMTNNNIFFNYTLPNANTSGEYQTSIYCIDGIEYGYSFFSFKLNNSGDNEQPSAILAIVILLPLIFAFIFMFGSISMGNDHVALKIFLFLLSLCSYISAAYFGMITLVKFYIFPEMNDALGLSVVVIGFVLFIAICYFLMYIFSKASHAAAQKKQERMEY